ncbi:hypothetical protein SMACR_05165 [Sordaria macrospora]|uniref:WGS project CABT00000000 data, contig 2.8 n=2 Tax=Sordaria macrospora TaxID=5147 RepID=F7VV71_SORMK|nr:uncharacterized protein SMAC_05165 [Sordaria macrospora k-hell]KAA8632435.1 hypothetical protein SMACR_05165 [Sordaria macrospora]KAH7628805.1 hypothetical protein B0T09DRAFT_168121 [Sordaria sp. MPI-SDFR-AT-0083]WPJ57289.1 hypothetical protein SMAC4_05165 [Sordaria macrospora]CCC09418.1 unnamed protein product [Sordaria macrospora k-hell]
MRFSLISAIGTLGSVVAQPVTRALTSNQMVDGLKQLTTKANALERPAKSITVVNSPLIVIGQGPWPAIVSGYTDIVSTATTIIAQTPGTQPSFGDSCEAVTEGYLKFASTNEEVLNILIGKAGILTQMPFIGPPVSAVLRQVEGVYDNLTIFLINTCESDAKNIQEQGNTLGAALEKAIKAYERLQV